MVAAVLRAVVRVEATVAARAKVMVTRAMVAATAEATMEATAMAVEAIMEGAAMAVMAAGRAARSVGSLGSSSPRKDGFLPSRPPQNCVMVRAVAGAAVTASKAGVVTTEAVKAAHKEPQMKRCPRSHPEV